jgi:hypothetical protein
MTLILAVLAAAVLPASGQSWERLRELQPGQMIKVKLDDGQQRTGTFRSISGERLTFADRKGEISIERAKIRRVQVRSGERRIRNLLIGAGIGAAIGVVTDNTLGAYLRNESGESSGARAATYLAPIGIVGGIAAAAPAYRTIYQAK